MKDEAGLSCERIVFEPIRYSVIGNLLMTKFLLLVEHCIPCILYTFDNLCACALVTFQRVWMNSLASSLG